MFVGERLREARTRQNLSLRALGKMTGFSASFLSQVELGQTAPSLGSLQRITDVLGITVASVLGPEVRAVPAAGGVIRQSSRGSLRSQWSKATVESLVLPTADEKLQAVLIRLEAEGRTGATIYARGRRLFAYCTNGTADLVLADPDEEFTVHAGDSVVIEGPRTLAWENRASVAAELIVVTAMVG